MKAVFGLEEGSRYEQLQQRLTALLNPQNSVLQGMIIVFPALQRDLGKWSPWGQLMRQIQEIDDLIYAEIGDRRAQPDPSRTDILSLMMSARDEQGQPMTDVELRDELMTLLIVGMAFAQFEMKLVLATVLSCWEMELADSQPVEPVRNGALLAPAQGLRMVVKGRRPEKQPTLQASAS